MNDGSRVPGPVNFDLINPPFGTFVDTRSAEIQISPRAPHDRRTLTLEATLPGFPGEVIVGTIVYEALLEDVLNPNATGPNNRECAHGNRVDTYDGTSEFDLRYSCNCSTSGFSGPNCNVAAVIAAAPATEQSPTVYIAVIVLFAVSVIVILSVVRYRRHKADITPADLMPYQACIIETLGIGSALNIQPHEIGLALSVPALLGVKSDRVATADAVHERVYESLSRLTAEAQEGLARKKRRSGQKNLFARLSLVNGRVDVDMDDGVVLVVLPRPVGSEDGFDTEVALALHREVKAKQFLLGHGFNVEDVSVAMPRCVPREIDRSSVVRLYQLGEGNFAEVVKVRQAPILALCTDSSPLVDGNATHDHNFNSRHTLQVEIRESKRSVTYPAAAKILKSSNVDVRDVLLKEAALMSMLVHKNVVGLIGVVSCRFSLPAC